MSRPSRERIVFRLLVFSLVFLFVTGTPGSAASPADGIVLSTTTSTENSGLLDLLLPAFEEETGIRVKVLPKGTGAALRDGRDGNADVLLVHAKAREERFVAEGYGAYRLAVMHNDFVIVGPPSDPAGVRGLSAAGAFRRIAAARSPFVSRGDDSGTHTKEQALWRASGLPLAERVRRIVKGDGVREIRTVEPGTAGGWYLPIGQGMGRALVFADEKRAYTLSDRGTFLRYRYGRRPPVALGILVEKDPALFNPYGVIPVSPRKHPHVNFAGAERFARWLVSPRAQGLIAAFRIEGRQAFFPDAETGERAAGGGDRSPGR